MGYVKSGYVKSGYVGQSGGIVQPISISSTITIQNATAYIAYVVYIDIISIDITLNRSAVPYYDKVLRINKIDDIILEQPIFVEDEFNYANYFGVENTDNLGNLAFDYVRKNTIEFNLTSNNSAWITYGTLKKIQNLDKSVEHILSAKSDSRYFKVLFNTTKDNIIATEVYRGALWYNIELKFIRKV